VTRCGLKLSSSEKDRYYAEQLANAKLVGLTSAPASQSEMADYFSSMQPELRVTAAARAAARFVALPPMPARYALTTPARPAWVGLAAAAAAMLPAWARKLYGLPGLPMTDLGASLTGRAIRAGLLAVPAGVRTSPTVKEARARVQ
jgi:uncharacterized protein (DUF2236 family)